MPATWSAAAGDFDTSMFGASRCLDTLISHLRDAIHGMSRHGMSGHGPGWGPPPWDKGFGKFKGGRGAGVGGPWGEWWPGPPGPPPRGPKASRGDVRAAILALLREGPRNGYQIMSEIEERSGGAWRPSPGAVYPALQQLADEGLIAGQESAWLPHVHPDRRGPPVHRGEPGAGPGRVGGDGPGRAG